MIQCIIPLQIRGASRCIGDPETMSEIEQENEGILVELGLLVS
jgi:hypothetical protein